MNKDLKNKIRLNRLTGKSMRICRFALHYNHGDFNKAYKMLVDNDMEVDRR